MGAICRERDVATAYENNPVYFAPAAQVIERLGVVAQDDKSQAVLASVIPHRIYAGEDAASAPAVGLCPPRTACGPSPTFG